MEVSSRRKHAFLIAFGVLVALVVVAIAARSSIPSGESGTRGPTQTLVDILFTLYLLTIASSGVLVVYLLVERHADRAGARRLATDVHELRTVV